MIRKGTGVRFYYILRGKEIIPCDIETWSNFFENPENKIIKQTNIEKKFISTVFLGLDHKFGYEEDKRPILFETMVFNKGEWSELYCERYHTYDEAVQGHNRIMEKVKNGEINERD